MKRKVIGVISLFCLLIFCFTLSSSAYDYTDFALSQSRTKLAQSGDDVYLLSPNNNRLLIEKIAPDTLSGTLTLSYPIVSCDAFSSTVCAICNDTDQHQLAVYLYDIHTDYLDSFFIRNQMIWSDIGFSLGNEGLYLLSADSGKKINRYSFEGKHQFSYHFNSDVSCITQGFEGCAYAVSQHTLYRLTEDAVITVEGASVSERIRFIADDILTDNSGNLYRLSQNTLTLLFRSDSSSLSGGVVSDQYFVSTSNTVNRYTESGEKTGYCTFNSNITAVCSSRDRLIVLTEEGGVRVNTLYPDDFINIGSSYPSDKAITGFSRDITSDIYTIDWENFYISDISPDVSVTQFMKNLSYSGYELRLYQDGVEKTSGVCATAMTAVFSGRNRYTFELSVTGDLNANGKVNTTDKNALMDYLIHVWSFSGVYLDAADINRDGAVDLLDTVMISRMIAK